MSPKDSNPDKNAGVSAPAQTSENGMGLSAQARPGAPDPFRKRSLKSRFRSATARMGELFKPSWKKAFIATLLGAAGYGAYLKMSNEYQKAWVRDLTQTTPTSHIKSYGIFPMSVSRRYELAQYIPDPVEQAAKQTVADQIKKTRPLAGFDNINMNTPEGLKTAQQKTLSRIADFGNPLVRTLKNAKGNAAVDQARAFVKQGALGKRFGSANEKVAVHAAVYLYLAANHEQTLAAQAYAQFNEAYRETGFTSETERRLAKKAARNAAIPAEEQMSLLHPRHEFQSEQMAAVQYNERLKIYDTVVKETLQTLGLKHTPMVMLHQQDIEDAFARDWKGEFNTVAVSSPYTVNENVIAINYNDQTIHRPFKPSNYLDEADKFDAHTYTYMTAGAIGEQAYHMYIDARGEEFLTGRLSTRSENYRLGVAAAVDTLAEKSGLDISRSTSTKRAYRFGLLYTMHYERGVENATLKNLGHPKNPQHIGVF